MSSPSPGRPVASAGGWPGGWPTGGPPAAGGQGPGAGPGAGRGGGGDRQLRRPRGAAAGLPGGGDAVHGVGVRGPRPAAAARQRGRRGRRRRGRADRLHVLLRGRARVHLHLRPGPLAHRGDDQGQRAGPYVPARQPLHRLRAAAGRARRGHQGTGRERAGGRGDPRRHRRRGRGRAAGRRRPRRADLRHDRARGPDHGRDRRGAVPGRRAAGLLPRRDLGGGLRLAGSLRRPRLGGRRLGDHLCRHRQRRPGPGVERRGGSGRPPADEPGRVPAPQPRQLPTTAGGAPASPRTPIPQTRPGCGPCGPWPSPARRRAWPGTGACRRRACLGPGPAPP